MVKKTKAEIVKTEPMKETAPKQKKPNAWLIHVKAFREKNPNLSYKDVLQKARETYKKGGNVEAPVEKKTTTKNEYPASYNPSDIKTYKTAESELMNNKASDGVMMKFYKSMKPSKYPANPKEWREKWGMMGNYYRFLDAQNIKQSDYDRVGIDSSLKDVEDDEGGAIKKVKKVRKKVVK